MDAESAFDQVVGDTDYAMYVITAAEGEERGGCLVGFTTQCSIRPLRFLVCLSKANRTYRLACRASALGVHLLRQDQRELASLFGEMTGDETDKFDRCRSGVGPEGVPLLSDCDSWFVGTVVGRFDLGDHEGFQLAPVQAERRTAVTPPTFRSVHDLVPGHRVEEA